MEGSCVACGATNNLQVYHIRRFSKKADAKSSIDQIVSKFGLKQLLVCQKCHNDIQCRTSAKSKGYEKTKKVLVESVVQ